MKVIIIIIMASNSDSVLFFLRIDFFDQVLRCYLVKLCVYL